MSFNPTGPATGPVPGPGSGPVPGSAPGSVPGPATGQPSRGAAGPNGGRTAPVALIGAAAMLLMEAVLLLLTLVRATDPLDAVLNLFGLGTQFIDAPAQFTAGDVAICAVLAAGVVGSTGGRNWGRTVIMTTMALVGYPCATSVLSELRTGEGRHAFTEGHNLLFNLVLVVEFLIAVGTLVAGFAISRGGTTAGAGPAAPVVGHAPMPRAMPGQMPLPAPGQPYGQQPASGQGYPQQQVPFPAYPAQPGPQGYPAQPTPPQPGQPYPHQAQQPAAPGYAAPPVPPQAGPPMQQPTPAPEANAYRPTQYSPPPGQPPVDPQGNPPVPPGA